MAVGSGLGAALGIATESTYGTGVAPSKWTEFESETIEWKPTRTEGKGLYNASGIAVARASQRATTSATVQGDVVMPMFGKGMGQWLGLIMGTLGSAPVQQGATTAYLQTHNLGSNAGQSATVQVLRPTMDGVLHPYNYLGLKATKAVFEWKLNEPVRMTVTVDGKDVNETTPAQGTPTYQTSNAPFFWHQCQFLMGAPGSQALLEGVREMTLTIERPQKVDNFYLDGTGRKQAPVQNGWTKITGSLTTDFLAKSAFADVFYADTPQEIVVNCTGPLIASTYYNSFNVTLPQVRFDTEPPKVAGMEIIQPKMTFQALYDDTNNPCQISYTSTDVAQ